MRPIYAVHAYTSYLRHHPAGHPNKETSKQSKRGRNTKHGDQTETKNETRTQCANVVLYRLAISAPATAYAECEGASEVTCEHYLYLLDGVWRCTKMHPDEGSILIREYRKYTLATELTSYAGLQKGPVPRFRVCDNGHIFSSMFRLVACYMRYLFAGRHRPNLLSLSESVSPFILLFRPTPDSSTLLSIIARRLGVQ